MNNSSTKKNNGALIAGLLIVAALAIGIILFISKGIKNKGEDKNQIPPSENDANYANEGSNANQKLLLFNNIVGFGREIFGSILRNKKAKNKNKSGNGNEAIKPEPKNTNTNDPIEEPELLFI